MPALPSPHCMPLATEQGTLPTGCGMQARSRHSKHGSHPCAAWSFRGDACYTVLAHTPAAQGNSRFPNSQVSAPKFNVFLDEMADQRSRALSSAHCPGVKQEVGPAQTQPEASAPSGALVLSVTSAEGRCAPDMAGRAAALAGTSAKATAEPQGTCPSGKTAASCGCGSRSCRWWGGQS